MSSNGAKIKIKEKYRNKEIKDLEIKDLGVSFD